MIAGLPAATGGPRARRFVQVAAVWLCAGVAAAGCSRKTTRGPTTAPVPVEVAPVESRAVPVVLAAVGTAEAYASVQLKPKVSGEILKIHFAEGVAVEAGQTLADIDPRPYEAALARARANLAIARAKADNAKEQLARYATLRGQGSASPEQYSQFAFAATAGLSEVEARQAEVDDAALSLEWTNVRAPISGRVGAALVKAGNLVRANTDVLAVINQTRPIHVAFTLPEDALADVRRWMEKGALAVAASDPARGTPLGQGTLAFIDNAVDRDSGTFALKAIFPNADESLWPGQFVEVALHLTEEAGALVIPAEAVMESQEGSQVFVVENGAAQLRKVRVARAAGPLAVIGEGLRAGEQVVTAGQLRLAPGTKVETVAVPGASPAPAGP